MRGYGSLFERLMGVGDKHLGRSRDRATMASEAAHLTKMLSTQAGSVQTLPAYGLPDLNDMRLSNAQVISVAHEHDQLRLSFSIEGQPVIDGPKRQVNFAARLDGSGEVRRFSRGFLP